MTTAYNPSPREAAAVRLGIGDAAIVRVSWSAIFAGTVLVLAIEVLLGVLGAGFGLGHVRPGAESTPNAGAFSMAAGIWWFVSTIIALVLGCFAAARMAGVASRFDGALHGLVIWGLTLLITAYLLTSAIGGLIGGAFSIVGGTLSAAGQGLKAAAPEIATAAGVSPDLLRQQAQAYLQPSNPDVTALSPQDAEKEIVKALPDLAAGGDRAARAKDRIVTIMAAQLKISKDEAAKRFDEVQARLQETKQQAVQALASPRAVLVTRPPAA